MNTTELLAALRSAFRDYATDGVPGSGEHEPVKGEIRNAFSELIAFLETLIEASGAGAVVYESKASMDADLAHDANTMAWVLTDSTADNNGIYKKSGASGSGSWVKQSDFSFQPAIDAAKTAALADIVDQQETTINAVNTAGADRVVEVNDAIEETGSLWAAILATTPSGSFAATMGNLATYYGYPTRANLVATTAPAGTLAVVHSDVIAPAVTNRSRSIGTNTITMASAHGITAGQRVNVRSVGGTGYEGNVRVLTVTTTTFTYKALAPSLTNETSTGTTGQVDRNGVYQSSGSDWSWIYDIGSSSIPTVLGRVLAEDSILRKEQVNATFDLALAPEITPRKQVVSINASVNLTAHIVGAGADDPMFFIDNSPIGHGTRNGFTWSRAWTAPATPDYDVSLKCRVNRSRWGEGNIVVAEALRHSQDVTTWTKANVTVTGGQSDPDGGSSAYRLLCAVNGTAVAHSVSVVASPISANPNASLEVWLRSGTASKWLIGSGGLTDNVYLDTTTGEVQSKWLDGGIVERRGDWSRWWFSQRNGGTPWNTVFIYLVNDFGTPSNTTAGTEDAFIYRPRLIDGVLPLSNYEKAGIRVGSVAYADRWIARSGLTDSVSSQTDINIDVVVPTAYDPTRKYPVLYVVEVEAVPGTAYQDGLQALKTAGIHDTYGCILARTFLPSGINSWFGAKNNDTQRHEEHIRDVMVGLVDARYSTIRNREGRLLIGFSKSGWGAVSLLLRNPTVFGYAASWDAPFGLQYSGQDDYRLDAFGAPYQGGNLGQQTHFGSQAQYQLYNPADILAAKKAAVNDRPRMVLAGSVTWPGDLTYFRGLCDTNGVPYVLRETSTVGTNGLDHNWVPASNPSIAAWIAPVCRMLFALR